MAFRIGRNRPAQKLCAGTGNSALRRWLGGKSTGSRKSRQSGRLRIEQLEPRVLLADLPLLISEFVADNETGLQDDFNPPRRPDWIEIYNPNPYEVNLAGWKLRDSNNEWTFPAGDWIVGPGGYFVVFASGSDCIGPGGKLHTNFALSRSGEYLALVKPNGQISHEYAPSFPQQYRDVSYGLIQQQQVVIASGAAARYHVPTEADAALGTSWTALGYDDSHFVRRLGSQTSEILITEIRADLNAYIEVQNVSDRTVDTTGWLVLVNDPTGGINAVNSVAWALPSDPARIAPGQVLYRTDTPGDNYWGSDITWSASSPGWAMIVDGTGLVMDFVAWGYTASQIANLNVNYGGLTNIRVTDKWSGDGVGARPSAGFVAFNDYVRGAGTHTNATTYVANGTASGPLKDITTGKNTNVTLSTSHSGAGFSSTSGTQPASGTDAYNVFNGYVDFVGSIALDNLNEHYTYTFTGLDTGGSARYSFTGSAVRGGSTYTNRFVLVELVGAVSATPAHSPDSTWIRQLSPTQVILCTGQNHTSAQGVVVRWTDIDPGPDGQFSVVSWRYNGAIPAGGNAGGISYALSGIRLEATGTANWLVRGGSADNNNASDWSWAAAGTKGAVNTGLVLPFSISSAEVKTGIGYDANPGGLTVKFYKADPARLSSIGSISTAESLISTPSFQLYTLTESAPYINYMDTGADGNYTTGNRPYPGQTIGVNVDLFAIEATGTLVIPQAGQWTFGVNSDDGFRLTLSNGIDPPYSMSYPGLRGPADTLATFNILRAGAYTMRLVQFENTGGAGAELFAAQGNKASWNPTDFRLVGDTASGGLSFAGLAGSIQTNVQDVLRNVNTSLWVRIPFQIDTLEGWQGMTLRMQYNDAFVAYLNGVEVARGNFTGTPAWNSAADSPRDILASMTYQTFNIGHHMDKLVLGTNVLAIHAMNVSAGDGNFLVLPELSLGKTEYTPTYFSRPTPGAPNTSAVFDVVADTKFSVDRGFYEEPFQLVISTATPGATIRYTLDGTEPTETTGIVYTGPITIDKTTTVRAAAFKPGFHPTNVDTQTYIFLADVVRQSRDGEPAPTLPNGVYGTFTTGLDGFVYADDPFGTSNPTKADGTRSATEGYGGGPGLKIVLGPDSGSAASGAFTKTFTLEKAGLYGVWLRYRMVLGADMATNEYGELVLQVNGTRYGADAGTSLIRRYGDGPGGNNLVYGWSFYGVNVNLNAGTNTIRVGAYMTAAAGSSAKWVEAYFDDIIVSQWPAASVNGQRIDYGMDPDIVDSATWGPQMRAALTQIPTISLVTDLRNLFDPSIGIYSNPQQDGPNWERPVSVEYILPDGSKGFQVNAGLRIRGGFSRSTSNPKHAFRLFFREAYGDAKLRYPLFGDQGAKEFDNLDLRCSQNYSWAFQGSTENAVVRDYFARSTQGAMGQPYTRSSPVHVYINGVYWGLYEFEERPEASFGETYLGGKKEDYDVIKVDDGYVLYATDGNMNAWTDLYNKSRVGFSVKYVKAKVPVDSLAAAEAVLADPAKQSVVVSAFAQTINYINTGSDGRYGGSIAFPGTTVGVDVDNFVVEVTGVVYIPEGQLGYWTFGVNCNDGFRLELTNGTYTFTAQQPNTQSTNTDTLAQFNFVQGGPYNLRLVYFENTGGSTLELFAAQGFYSSFSAGTFRLVNDVPNFGLMSYTPEMYYCLQGLNPDGTRNPNYPVLLDVDNLITQMLVVFFGGDRDAPVSNFLTNLSPNNFYALRDRNGQRGFVFPLHDAEHTLRMGMDSRVGPWPAGKDGINKSQSQYIHQQMMAYPEYRMRFADLAHKYLMNDGLLTSNVARARFQALADQISMAIIAESARWGDAHSSRTTNPLTKDHWATSINNELSWISGRAATVLNQLRSTTLPGNSLGSNNQWINGAQAPLYPNVAAPVFKSAAGMVQHGGEVDPGFALRMDVPGGQIFYYSLDGTDPRLPGGAVNPSPSVKVYTGLVVLDKTTRVMARAYNPTTKVWSALNEAWFYVGRPAAAGNLVITELNYNPHDPTPEELAINPNWDHDSFEFIELYNPTNYPIDLTGARFDKGITFDFSTARIRELKPGEFAILVADAAAFQARYPGVPVAGVYTGQLSNNGERLRLLDRFGKPILDFKYSDSGKWPGRADGKGATLVPVDYFGDLSDPDNWNGHRLFGGNPGQLGRGPSLDVVINEVVVWPGEGQQAAIELYNRTQQTIDITGWYLSNSSSILKKYRIPAEKGLIGPGGYAVFYQSEFAPGGGTQITDIVFSPYNPNEVWLMEANAAGKLVRFADKVDTGVAARGSSFGRSPSGTGDFALLSAPTLGETNSPAATGPIVINELHVNPDVKTEPVEFVELYNNSPNQTIDLSGWYFSDGINYTIPDGVTLAPGQYLVIAQDPAAVRAKFSVPSNVQVLGPYKGRLANEGELLVLRDSSGLVQDRVDYGLGFPWPTVGDPPGYSMELIHPSLDNDLGGSWRSSIGQPATVQVLIDAESTWSYFKGTAEPPSNWRTVGFNPSPAWPTGQGAIGYGDEYFINTTLSDMPGNYSTVYLRKTFTVSNPAAVSSLVFEALFDDGINVWINGTHVLSSNVAGANLPYTATALAETENGMFVPFVLPNPSSYLVAGTNVIAVQLLNSARSGSEDAYFDGRLVAYGPSNSGATPGRQNSVYAVNAPPQMRQVKHTPKQPASGQPVTITVKVTDPDGVAQVNLYYQIVEPGDYINISDPRYTTQWTVLPMRDDGKEGDLVAGDSIYTVVLPESLQVNRRLIRYRISAMDTLGALVVGPYADDPQPNFAYFVYDGVPDWTGAVQPGVTPPVTYPSDLLQTVPVYTLLTRRQDHLNAMYVPYRPGQPDQMFPTRTSGYTGEDYLWRGTLVYNGEVYDHISYRARGGVWRYAMGKNMWKIDFNRGHDFQAYDNYGQPYSTKWTKLNLGAVIQQGDYWHRGEHGLFEAVSYRLFQMAGVPAPHTHYAHFRIVAGADENGPDQYSGDFQGLYLVVEQPDGRFLDEHGLPDGNLYKVENYTGTLNNQGPTQPSDGSDFFLFRDGNAAGTVLGYTDKPDLLWWQQNVELQRYYSYRAIVEAVHHYDIGYGKNYFYYHDPETGRWSVLPWDVDLTWADNMYGNGDEPFISTGTQGGNIFRHPALLLDYRNRMREIRDLLYNTEQTGWLIDEYARFIYTPGQLSLVDADRAMWDYNPILGAVAYGGSNNARASAAGSGENTATYTFNVTAGAQYRVYATWPARPGSATNTPFTIRDGNTTLATVAVNQATRPLDIVDSFVGWKDLGTYTITGTQLVVVISNNANGTVLADGVRIERVGTTTKQLMDNTSASFTGSWSTISGYSNYNKAGMGRFYAGNPPSIVIPSPGGFQGMINKMKSYVSSRSSWIASNILTDDSQVPFGSSGPTITYIGPTGYPVDALRFRAPAYSSPVGTPFAAMKWRIAEVTPPGSATFDPTKPMKYEIDPVWESEEITTYTDTITIPSINLEPGKIYRVRLRFKDNAGRWSHWSAPVQFVAGGAIGSVPYDLRVTEIMYNPPPDGGAFSPDNYEYIELYNAGPQPISLSGTKFTLGITYTLSPTVTLNPGQYALVVTFDPSAPANAARLAAFRSYYNLDPSVPIIGGNGIGQLDDNGERVVLKLNELTICDFTYGDSGPWPTRADGGGSSLELIDLNGPYNVASNWRASWDYRGSPGRAASEPITGIIINELLTNSAAPQTDAIELWNTSSQPIDVTGWYLSDSSTNYQKFRIPDGAGTIPAGGFVYFTEAQFNPGGGSNPTDLVLNGVYGGQLHLLAADASGRPTQFVDFISFGPARVGESFGRWNNDQQRVFVYPMRSVTLGEPNSGPRVGTVLISELMYNPAGGNPNLEYVEIYNPGDQPVDLYRWTLGGSVQYSFPAGTILGPRRSLVMVGFDPTDPSAADAFRTAYDLPAWATLLGPWIGTLPDQAGVVRLFSYDQPPPGEPGYYPPILEDEVSYVETWAGGQAGGSGMALLRQQFDLWGNQASNWAAGDPTPGFVGAAPVAEVVGRWVFYNDSAFDGRTPGASIADDAAIAPDKQPLLPGQQATFLNYTSYTRGINGIMIDVLGLAAPELVSAADFSFRSGNSNQLASWVEAAGPQIVDVRPRDDAPGVWRISLIWSDDTAVKNQWLEVTVKATAATGLPVPDVFYFGNAIGETGDNAQGENPDAWVTTADAEAVRANRTGITPAAITNLYDFNRDRRVNSTDEMIARNNPRTGPEALQLIDLRPPGGNGMLAEPLPAELHQAILSDMAERLALGDDGDNDFRLELGGDGSGNIRLALGSDGSSDIGLALSDSGSDIRLELGGDGWADLLALLALWEDNASRSGRTAKPLQQATDAAIASLTAEY